VASTPAPSSSGRFFGVISLAGGVATVAGFGIEIALYDKDHEPWVDVTAFASLLIGGALILIAFVGLYDGFALRNDKVGVVALASLLLGLLALLGVGVAITYALLLGGVVLFGIALFRVRAVSLAAAITFVLPLLGIAAASTAYSDEELAYASGIAVGVPFVIAGIELAARGGGAAVRAWTLSAFSATVLIVIATVFTFGFAAILAPVSVVPTLVAARRDGRRSAIWWVTAVANVWLLLLFAIFVLALLG